MEPKELPAAAPDDSIWDVEHQCSVMSRTSILAEAQRCLDNSDAVAMETLLMELGGVQYKEHCTQQVLEMVFSQDAASIANICFSVRDVQDWSDANTDHLIGKCPQLFAQWAAPVASRVRAIAGFFSKKEDSIKCNILEGRDVSIPGQVLHTLLNKDESLWQELSVDWIGEKGSVLRATASAAGWTPEILPNMLKGRWISRTEHWGNVFDYPCALCLANDAVARLGYKARQDTAWMVGKSAFMALLPIKFLSNANPLDVALAEIITQRVPMDYVLEKNPDIVEVSMDVREQLKNIVDVHLSLGCLNLLVEALSRDTIPGVQERIESTIALPELDAATH